MIKYEKGSILEINKGYIVQQVSCKNAYGAGISGAIAKKWPKVEQAYRTQCKKAEKPEIQFHLQIIKLENDLFCVNVFSQKEYGNSAKTGKIYTDMETLIACLTAIANRAQRENLPVYIPYKIGCGLAGGNWNELANALDLLDNEKFNVMILPQDVHKVKDNFDGYVLISVCEGEILTQRFGTLKAAQETMHKEMIETGVLKEDSFFTADDEPEPLEEDEYFDLYAFYPYGEFTNNDKYIRNWHIAPL